MERSDAEQSEAESQPGEQANSQGEGAAAETAEVEGSGKEEIADDVKQAIFEAGQEAGTAGVDAELCPYSDLDERGDIWRRGHKLGAETRPPEKAMAAAAEFDEAAAVPERFRSLVIGRMVYYAERVNSDHVGELPAIVVRVVSQAEGLVNLQVIRNDSSGMTFTQNVSYEPSGRVRKTWRWPQGE